MEDTLEKKECAVGTEAQAQKDLTEENMRKELWRGWGNYTPEIWDELS